jgi:flagellar motility protein MotE (MotC chaperone)
MNDENRSTNVFKTLLKSFNLQKNILNGEISQLLKNIDKKKQNIAKFVEYNKEYKSRINEKV